MPRTHTNQRLVDLLVPDIDADTRVVDLRDPSDPLMKDRRSKTAVAGDNALIDQARAGRSC